MFTKKIGIDLGTVNILVYEAGRGIVLEEPSVVARNNENGKIIAVGKEARRMLGRTPGNIRAIRPLRGGVIADFAITEIMLKYLLSRIFKRKLFLKPVVMICVPAGITSVEKRAVIDVCSQVGARKSFLIEEPLAAAIGTGLPISEPGGNMIVDIGGGTTEIAVISLGGIVISSSLRLGGDSFDTQIVRYIRNKHNLVIGEKTAEEIKIEIGAASCTQEKKQYQVKGMHLATGLTKKVVVNTEEIVEAYRENIYNVIEGIKNVLEQTPPELSSDIMDKGIVLTGGGCLLTGLAELVSREIKVPVFVADEPLHSVARGTGQALEEIDKLSDILVSNKNVN